MPIIEFWIASLYNIYFGNAFFHFTVEMENIPYLKVYSFRQM